MKRFFLAAFVLCSFSSAHSQITITASDMPTVTDSLRYSFASPLDPNISTTSTGANTTWNFSAMMPIAQGVDRYKTAAQVNPFYALTISQNAYGYKVADTIPGGSALPIVVNNIYSFFSKKDSPSRFVTEAFAANISGIPTPANYSNEDEVYYFPLAYNDVDSSDFALNISIATLGSLKTNGTRKTTVDGYGKITTPYATATDCIRVRSVVDEVDSVSIAATAAIGIPRKTVEYKWLANGEHYPLLWITANVIGSTETISNVRYRDTYRASGVKNVAASIQKLNAYPNPAANMVKIEVPASWKNYQIEVFDIKGQLVGNLINQSSYDCSSLATGVYIARVIAGEEIGYVNFTKE